MERLFDTPAAADTSEAQGFDLLVNVTLPAVVVDATCCSAKAAKVQNVEHGPFRAGPITTHLVEDEAACMQGNQICNDSG